MCRPDVLLVTKWKIRFLSKQSGSLAVTAEAVPLHATKALGGETRYLLFILDLLRALFKVLLYCIPHILFYYNNIMKRRFGCLFKMNTNGFVKKRTPCTTPIHTSTLSIISASFFIITGLITLLNTPFVPNVRVVLIFSNHTLYTVNMKTYEKMWCFFINETQHEMD
jgi:hypothetical protein